MRLFGTVLICLALLSTPVLAQALKADDFRPAMPSRTMLSYDKSLSYYPGQKMILFQDKQFGYKLYAYVLTRKLVQEHIQKVIDQFQITDPAQIDNLINKYVDYTPQNREVLVLLFYTAPNIANRFYVNHLGNLEQTVYLEYGSQRVEDHVVKARELMAKQRRDIPTQEEMVFDGGTRPLYLDMDKDYLYYPEKVVLEDQGWDSLSKAYRWAFAFHFNDQDIARIEEFMLNGINVDFSLVLTDPEFFSYMNVRPHMRYQILNLIDPEFVDYLISTEQMVPVPDPGKIAPKLWLK
jgi:hypothetical protein